MGLFRRKPKDAGTITVSGQKLIDGEGLHVTALPPDWYNPWRGLRGSYGYLYRTQPNVRTVVDFLARQGAAVKLKLYEKVPSSPTLPDGRIESPNHEMMAVLNKPNPLLTRTQLWKRTIADLHIYDVAYWQKVKIRGQVVAVNRIPPISINEQRDPLTNQVTSYFDRTGRELTDLLVFPGFDPELSQGATSPLETLRRVLAEEQQAGLHRTALWRNGARREGVVSRPAEVTRWSPEAREAWRADFESTMSGSANAGRVAILEDGMTWTPDSFSSKEMEYLGGRTLTRKECAAAFGVDPRMVFAHDEAISPEIRTAFYVDRLVPMLVELAEEIDRQLLPDFEPLDADSYYSEFNIDAKLKGSFEEQARIASAAVGGPFVTVNEMRARLNLPPIEGGDAIFIPLNSARGGGPQGSPQAPMQTPGQQPTDVTPSPNGQASIHLYIDGKQAAVTPAEDRKPGVPQVALRRRDEVADRYAKLISKTLARQGRLVVPMVNGLRKSGEKMSGHIDMVWGDQSRWDLELASDLQTLTEQVVDQNARRAMGQLRRKAAYDPSRTRKYISVAAANTAKAINDKTKQAVSSALADDSGEELDAVFADQADRAGRLGASLGTQFINFGRTEGAVQGGGRTKSWIVTSQNSRHPEMNGETVDIRDTFSNGLEWPGQFGNPDESAGCMCLVDLS